jgi:hypothetical protein
MPVLRRHPAALAVALAASGLLATGITVVITSAATAQNGSPRAHFRKWVPPTRVFPAWKIPSHGGAAVTAAGARIPACAARKLSVRYWTSWPAMDTVLNGFNVTNTGAPCELPTFPGKIVLTRPDGAAVPATRLAGLAGVKTAADFIRFGSPGTVGVAGSPAQLRAAQARLTLDHGGTAVVILDSFIPPAAQTGGAPCIATPRGGGLRVSLPGGALSVPMPAGSWTRGNAVDPTGAAFYSCGTVVVSPFMTWRQAVGIVGIPVPDSRNYGVLPLAHTSQYKAAP